MSSNFIGSKIAIITKTQCRYVGTIIGIDPTTSSILLGTVTCFGTENRPGNFITSQIAGTVVPMMQFANSDIEDLKIVDDEYIANEIAQKKVTKVNPPIGLKVAQPTPSAPAIAQPSIHDDPAIVSAVMGSSKQEHRLPSSVTNQLMAAFDQMTVSNESAALASKKQGQMHETMVNHQHSSLYLGPNTVEIQSSWPTVRSSNAESNDESKSQASKTNKSRFFDQYSSNSSEPFQSIRPNSNQTSRAYSQQNQSNFRGSNGHYQNSSRSFYQQHRSGPMSNPSRRPGGNRETFQSDFNGINDEFDFESNNRNFKKLTSEEESAQGQTSQPKAPTVVETATANDFKPIYDKKKSFFDNPMTNNLSDSSTMTHRTLNQETFGNDGYSRRSKHRGNGNFYRRTNNQHRSGNNSNGQSYQY